MKVIAKKINNPFCDYLTEGKEYEAKHGFGEDVFYITDDEGHFKCCAFKDCGYIHGDWTIITDKAKVR